MKKKIFFTFVSFFVIAGCISKDKRPGVNSVGQTLWQSATRKPVTDLVLVGLNSDDPSKESELLLIDLKGNLLQKWHFFGSALTSRLGPDGLVYSILISDKQDRLTSIVGECDEIIGIDQNSKKQKSLRIQGISHDFDFVGNDIATFKLDKATPSDLKKLWPKSSLKKAFADALTVVNWNGQEIWSWKILDHLKDLKLDIGGGPNASLTHGNSIQFLKSNPLSESSAFLLSYRHLNLVVLVEYPSGKILWQSPPHQLSRQHDATLIGTSVLVFDNGISDLPNMAIKEWDITQNQLKFQWSLPHKYMTTSIMGGVRKLSNGSFLISNSVWGNLIEVNADGDIDWSFLFSQNSNSKKLFWPIGTGFFRAEVYLAGQFESKESH